MSDSNERLGPKAWRFFEANFEKLLAVFFLSTMVILLSAIVFFRFVLNRGLSFAVEIERMAFVWFVYAGAAYAARQRRHIRVEAQLLLLNDRARAVLRVVADLAWVGFNIVIVREGIRVVGNMIRFPYESPALGISMAYAYSIVPLSFFLITIRVVQYMVQDIRRLLSGKG